LIHYFPPPSKKTEILVHLSIFLFFPYKFTVLVINIRFIFLIKIISQKKYRKSIEKVSKSIEKVSKKYRKVSKKYRKSIEKVSIHIYYFNILIY